jgi:hypothetical protein
VALTEDKDEIINSNILDMRLASEVWVSLKHAWWHET